MQTYISSRTKSSVVARKTVRVLSEPVDTAINVSECALMAGQAGVGSASSALNQVAI